ncbi:MgtC/SapB family protein [Actinomadura scrupuli]|uniref:MgtC/SapB family protein n=1 Tax=Actinomadura scrupuli TaxID=559629 RepID=UPI003D954FCD
MHWITVLQVVVAAGLGGAIGFERELDAQSAGLRTHILVALGAALFTVAGADALHTDPTRVAAQVVTGIGFLGAGAILREGPTVKGLTTAASLWVTAASGVAVGLRAWLPALVTAVLTLSVLRLLKRAEFTPRRTLEMTVELNAGTSPTDMEETIRGFMPSARVTRVRHSTAGHPLLSFLTRVDRGQTLTSISERLLAIEGVCGVDLAR